MIVIQEKSISPKELRHQFLGPVDELHVLKEIQVEKAIFLSHEGKKQIQLRHQNESEAIMIKVQNYHALLLSNYAAYEP